MIGKLKAHCHSGRECLVSCVGIGVSQPWGMKRPWQIYLGSQVPASPLSLSLSSYTMLCYLHGREMFHLSLYAFKAGEARFAMPQTPRCPKLPGEHMYSVLRTPSPFINESARIVTKPIGALNMGQNVHPSCSIPCHSISHRPQTRLTPPIGAVQRAVDSHVGDRLLSS